MLKNKNRDRDIAEDYPDGKSVTEIGRSYGLLAHSIWAVEALPRLLEANEYTIPPSHEQTIREVAQENNSVRFFLEESPTVRVVPDSQRKPSTRISEGKLFREYWTFCFGPGGAKPVGLRAFRQRMRELQSDLGFELTLDRGKLGQSEAFYVGLTVVGEKAA